MFLHGIADYAWDEFVLEPPLSAAQKQEVADLLDGFKTKEDVIGWLETKGDAVTPQQRSTVLYFVNKSKLLDLSPVAAAAAANAVSLALTGTVQKEETPWLLYAGAAALAFALLRKRG